MMWKKAVGIYFMACLAAECGLSPVMPSALSSFLAPQAQARSFGRRFFGRRPRGVSRTVFRPSSSSQQRGFGSSNFRSSSFGSRQQAVFVNQGRDNNGKNKIKDVAGFSSLSQQGNALLERDRVNPFLFRRLFIDPNTGSLLGASRGETVRQLRDFYLKNFDKFKGNARNVVQNFLVANGAASALNGQLRADLVTGVAPKYKNLSDREVRERAFNNFLNTFSQSSRLVRTKMGPDGTVSINTNGLFRKAALALFTNDNPYACGQNVAPRLDFMIARATDPFVYNQLMEISTLQDEAAKVGVEDDKRRTARNKIVIAAPPGAKIPESIVGIAKERTLEHQGQQRRPGLDWFISWDTFGNSSPGVETESRNPFDAGINFTNDASEAIWHKSNGFLQFGLFNADGAAQTQAPGNVALGTGFGGAHLGDAVQTPVNCMVCHANGFRGGGIAANGKPYTDNTLGIDQDGNNIGSRIPSFHKGFFTSNADYFSRAKRASAIFLNAMKRSNSFVPSNANPNDAAALLPDFVNEYREPLSFATAAKELGTSVESLQSLFGRKDGKIERAAFEKTYCSLRQRVGNVNSVLNGGVRQSLNPASRVNGLTGQPAHNQNAGGITRPRR